MRLDAPDAPRSLPSKKASPDLGRPRITLSEAFFQSLKEDVIAFDLGSLYALSQSPIAVDLFRLFGSQIEAMRRTGERNGQVWLGLTT